METRPVRTDENYEAAPAEIGGLLNAPKGSPQAERLEVLSTLAPAYEERHYPMAPPVPTDALHFVMHQRELTQRNLPSG